MVMESGWSWADKPDAARQGFQAPLLDPIAARCPPQSRTSCTHRASVRGTREATALRFLASDDPFLDPLVDVLGNDLPAHEFVLALVGTALDDRLGPGAADVGERVQLALRGRVDVDQGSALDRR